MSYYKHTDWNGKLELRDNWVTIALHMEEDGKLIETHTLTGDKDYWIIGRMAGTGLSSQTPTAIVDIEATHASCSQQHCVIQLRAPDHVYLFDLSSSGTFVNDVRVKRLTYNRLRHMDVVRVGRSNRSIRIELHEQEVHQVVPLTKNPLLSNPNALKPPGLPLTTNPLLSNPSKLSSNPRSVISFVSSTPDNPGLDADRNFPPQPTVPFLKGRLSPSATKKRKLEPVKMSPKRSSSNQTVPPENKGDYKRLKIKISSFKTSVSRSPDIQPMPKPYEKALREEEQLFLKLETTKQRLHLLEIVRAEQRLESKKDLADTLKFDDTNDSPRRSSTLNEYLESFTLEFLPNFQKASENLLAEEKQLTKQWKAARVEMKKLRPPLIPRFIPVLCVSPRSRSASMDGSFNSFPSLKLNHPSSS